MDFLALKSELATYQVDNLEELLLNQINSQPRGTQYRLQLENFLRMMTHQYPQMMRESISKSNRIPRYQSPTMVSMQTLPTPTPNSEEKGNDFWNKF